MNYRQATHVVLPIFLGSFKEPPNGEHRAARPHNQSNPIFWVFDELPGSDEHPPGDASQFGSILVFRGFGVLSVRGKR